MVLFIMVVMLFNLKSETIAFSKGLLSKILKVSMSVLIFALIASSLSMSFADLNASQLQPYEGAMRSVKELSALLFTKYVFAFESISILLIVVIVGAVALARAKGGTHASDK
jgi:NADH-quinone oxidoreductase subunit J